MGEVWSARNVLTNRDFAIKFLLQSLACNTDALRRFVSEARATGQLRHPSIVSVYDAGQTRDGRPYLVMELLEGESLEQCLARETRLDPLSTCGYLAQVARALELAHRSGIVHRDLSSANIFLARGGDGSELIPKILDFGVSKFVGPGHHARVRTGDGAILGSPSYMSPEQARGAEGADSRTDLWSLGVLMYECLSGTLPFEASNYNALMLAIITRDAPPLAERAPDADPELVQLCERCMTKDREARVQTAQEVAQQLEQIAIRLSEESGDRRFVPRRRRTDRISRLSWSAPPPSPSGRPSVTPQTPAPLGVRCWQFLTRPAPRVVAAGTALGGTAVGFALGVVLATQDQGAPSRDPRASQDVQAKATGVPARASAVLASETGATSAPPPNVRAETAPTAELTDRLGAETDRGETSVQTGSPSGERR